MVEFICIVLAAGAGGMYLRLRGKYLQLRGKYAAQLQAATDVKKKSDEYYQLWGEAVSLLGINGQLTPEQIAMITPQVEQTPQLQAGDGFSSHRRDTEIARAKNGLPPADNLEGMHSAHIRDVHKARIKYGTVQE